MAASEQNNRRAERAELSRHITTDETVAFMTALIAFLDEAHAARNHGAIDTPPPPMDSLATPAHAADPAPTEALPSEQQPASSDQHTDATAPSPHDVTPVLHADASAGSGILGTGGNADPTTVAPDHVTASVQTEGHVDAASVPLTPDHVPGAGDGTAHADVNTTSVVDPGTSLDQLGSTITNLVDTSLAVVSHTLDSLSTTVTQLTSSVTGTIGQLADNVTGIVGGLLHSVGGGVDHAPATNLVDALVTDIVSSPLNVQHDGASAHDAGIAGLDTAGAVPMAALPPLTLHLGFLGQPTGDGHDVHDGAFSALGVHHF
ncbi:MULTISPECIES: hypothetical protein [unclassified Bradyrhizobium]|uniref:hypothetical protein n=1 Tax=unclassified Bradyrhizobium TaxID=2631580 RepID=UPI001FF7A8E0|nr:MULTISPECIES: hypothetical protein [unclassified Bradyrhizobium]MCK1710135.1 hypothetical protein [Bradyrhizobium sp. 143]MCK1732115.1 hypothetical protein [Bradyrhizobium sp. 142]